MDPRDFYLEPDRNRNVERLGGLVALSFRSSLLLARHLNHRRAGGSWDFVTYKPHVSFIPDDGRRLENVCPFDGPLIFGPEVSD